MQQNQPLGCTVKLRKVSKWNFVYKSVEVLNFFSKAPPFMDLESSILFLITSPFLASLDKLIQWCSEEPQKLPLKLIDGSHFPRPREN